MEILGNFADSDILGTSEKLVLIFSIYHTIIWI